MNRRKANSSIRKSAAATGHATMADPQMANKHTKCSTALAVREPQIKATVRLCYTLTTRPCYALTTSVSKRRDNSKCWRATENACSARVALLMAAENGVATLKNSLASSLKPVTAIPPSNYTLGYLSQKNENLYSTQKPLWEYLQRLSL